MTIEIKAPGGQTLMKMNLWTLMEQILSGMYNPRVPAIGYIGPIRVFVDGQEIFPPAEIFDES